MNVAEDSGPWMWRNANLAKTGSLSIGALEIGLYVDSWRAPFTDTVGPFTFLDTLYNEIPDEYYNVDGYMGPPILGLAVRVEQYLHSEDFPDDYVDDTWEQADSAVYHGGDASDELAALVSLAIGERVRSAGIIRVFGSKDEDQRGYPHRLRNPIHYSPRPYFSRILPYTGSSRRQDTTRVLKLIGLYSSLASSEAAALVRAARTYQEALWIAEDDPRQAWLRLVSAAETIAQLAPDMPAEARLKKAFPETESSTIVKRLLETGDDELIEWAARRLADQGRSTKKFLDFLIRYRPRQPSRRPAAEAARVDWSKLRKQLSRIYAYRSSDLHAGIPFPTFICEVPRKTPKNLAHEVGREPGRRNRDATILLHVFEYIVRGAIQNWWLSAGRANRER